MRHDAIQGRASRKVVSYRAFGGVKVNNITSTTGMDDFTRFDTAFI
jgi:hypothetical protein